MISLAILGTVTVVGTLAVVLFEVFAPPADKNAPGGRGNSKQVVAHHLMGDPAEIDTDKA